MLNHIKEILLIPPKNKLAKGEFEYKVIRKFYFILTFVYIFDLLLIIYYKHYGYAFFWPYLIFLFLAPNGIIMRWKVMF